MPMPPSHSTSGPRPHPSHSARPHFATSSHRAASSSSPDWSDEDDDDDEGGFEADAPLLDRTSSRDTRRNFIKMQRLNSHSVDDGVKPAGDAKKKGNGTSSPSSASLGYDGAKDDAVQGTRTAVRPAAGTGLNSDSEDDDPELSMRLDDLFDPNKSAVENKSLLVSAELDRMGMGRYQWFIFFLCGLGFFIDLLWAQALGLVATPIKNEFVSATESNIGLLSTAFSVGLTVGAFMWGFLVDVVGRRWSFYLTCLISSIFGLAAGGSGNYATLCTLTAFVGLGVGGNIPIDATITLEFLPTVSIPVLLDVRSPCSQHAFSMTRTAAFCWRCSPSSSRSACWSAAA
jgi:Sugar (and other) transporter